MGATGPTDGPESEKSVPAAVCPSTQTHPPIHLMRVYAHETRFHFVIRAEFVGILKKDAEGKRSVRTVGLYVTLVGIVE